MWIDLFIAAFVLALGAHAAWLARRQAGLAALLQTEREQRCQLERDLTALLACSREIGERTRRQGTRQRSLIDQLNQLEQHVDSGAGIEQAERLMENGLALEQISSICHLSQGEAALLERWARHRKAA